MTNNLKKDKVKLELIADITMLLMVEKGITDGTCEYKCEYIIIIFFKESPYLKCWDLYGQAILQQLPVGGFAWVDEDISS